MSQEVEDKESLARAQLPYRAEYCKTSRAKCKKCSEPMMQNSLKLANMTKSRFHDGYDANFYHVPCFFQIKRPSSVAEIRHYEILKFEDQKMLLEAIETNGLSVLGETVEINNNGKKKSADKTSKTSSKKSKKRDAPSEEGDNVQIKVNYDDFLLEYAKSGRSKCVKCEEKIEKAAVRIGKYDYDADTPYQGGPVPRWYHVDCFVKRMKDLEFFGVIEKVAGYEDLEKDHRKMLRKVVKPIEADVVALKKIKSETKPKALEDIEEEEKLKIQSDRQFALREFVESMKRKDIETMLEHMRQKSSFKSSTLLVDMATEVLLFGPFKKCPVCKQHGGILLRGCSYICTKEKDGVPCTYESRTPKRGVPDVPEEIVEGYYEFFDKKYKFHGGERIFPKDLIKAVEEKEAENSNIVQEGGPLDGLTIGVISWKHLKTDKDKITRIVTKLGGKIQRSLESSLFVILTSQDGLDKEDPKVEVAKELGVPFATEDFLFKIETKEDVKRELDNHLIV